jgi:hypothetical protein
MDFDEILYWRSILKVIGRVSFYSKLKLLDVLKKKTGPLYNNVVRDIKYNFIIIQGLFYVECSLI